MDPMSNTAASFACGICNEVFSSRNMLFRHLKNTDEVHTSGSITAGQPELKKQRVQNNDDGIYTVCEDDDWYRVLVKPQGLATMGTRGITLMRSDKLLLPDAIKLQLHYKKAVPCHRLDRATGGVMLCSKSKLAERVLMTCFKVKLVHKKYMAIVVGKLEPAVGTIETPISGKPALTKYSVTCCTPSKQYGWISTVELWPVTGKNHQLRRHLQSIGHSIINDKRYSLPQLWTHIVRSSIDSMFLWAVEIDFPHPRHCTELVANNEEGVDTPNKPARNGADDSDGESSDEEEEEERALPAGRRCRTEIVAELRGLTADQRVVATIPEPAAYAEFRAIHARSVLQEEEKNTSD